MTAKERVARLWDFCAEVKPRVGGPATLSPWTTGIYFLICEGTIVYVGQSVDVQRRVDNHATNNRRYLKRPETRCHAMPFDRAMWMRLPSNELEAFESTLIRLLRPRHNKHAPDRALDRDASILAALGLEAA